jgi:hypothetical protein
MDETPQRSLLAAVFYELRRKNTPLEQGLILPAALVIFGVVIGLQAIGIIFLPTISSETAGEAAAIGGGDVVVLIVVVRLTAYAIERRRRGPH